MASEPPRQEAALSVGFDARAREYVAHRLDRFGADGARVVATGSRDGDRLVLTLPYAEGAFRDTFTFEPGPATWSLRLAAQGRDGPGSTFARFSLVRVPGP
jgi:hypothetical protein